MPSSPQAFVASGAMIISGFIMWRRAMKVSGLSTGTATSKIATAAKGFVELTGIARPIGNIPLTDPVTYQSCVWFHVITEEKRGDKWKVVSTATSDRPFLIEDRTGRCVVTCTENDFERDSPDIVSASSDLRHKVWRFHNGDPIYALGHLMRLKDGVRPEEKYERDPSSASGLTAYDKKKKITENMMGLLKLWKQDQRNLIARFDTDGNGRVDSQEWEKAQAKARELAEKKSDSGSVKSEASVPASTAASGLDKQITHQLIRPTDGRPLLVTKGTEQSLTTRHRWKSIFGLALFIGGIACGVFLIRQP